MKFTNAILIGLSALPSLISAAPQPEAIAEAAPAPEAGITNALTKRESNGANCWRYTDYNRSYWRLSTWGPWDDDWGHGLLDNLRGQCGPDYGNLENWAFGYEAGVPPTDGWTSFDFDAPAYSSNCVQSAVWLAR